MKTRDVVMTVLLVAVASTLAVDAMTSGLSMAGTAEVMLRAVAFGGLAVRVWCHPHRRIDLVALVVGVALLGSAFATGIAAAGAHARMGWGDALGGAGVFAVGALAVYWSDTTRYERHVRRVEVAATKRGRRAPLAAPTDDEER